MEMIYKELIASRTRKTDYDDCCTCLVFMCSIKDYRFERETFLDV